MCGSPSRSRPISSPRSSSSTKFAVGDLSFKKMPGQDGGRGRAGRTVLFVSHNMAMISSLCQKAMQLDGGELRAFGATDQVILGYAARGGNLPAKVNYRNQSRQIGDQYAQLLSADVRNEQGAPVTEVEITQPFSVRMEYRIAREANRVFVPNFHFHCQDGNCAFIVNAIMSKNCRRVTTQQNAMSQLIF